MTLTRVELSGIDGATGSIATASINNIKNSASASNNLVLNSDGTTTLTPSNIIKSGTTVASTSGTAIDFTGIPSWVKRITVMFSGVSTNGASNLLVQIGAGSTTTTGYESVGTVTGGSGWDTNISTSTAGFLVKNGEGGSTNRVAGQMVLATMGANLWTACHNAASGATINRLALGSGLLTLSGTLDRVRITTVNGTDTFDAGSINILYEG